MKLFKWSAVLILVVGMSLGVVFGVGAQSQPKAGGTLVIAQFEEPDTLDPAATGMIESLRVLEYIVEPLVTLNKDLEPVPLLAKAFEWSDDHLSLTFHLLDNVVFQDGTPLTADAVKRSLDRFKAKSAMNYMLKAVDQIVAVDEHTVVLKLSSPAPQLLYNLADGHMGILSPKMLSERSDEEIGTQVLIGTGPFELSNWVHGDHITLTRFDGYHHGPAFIGNRGPAYLKTIEFRVIPEDSVRVEELTSGTVDISFDIPTNSVISLQNNPDVRLEMAPTYSVQYLAMNSTRPGLDDKVVRVAIAEAIDKDTLLKAAWNNIGSIAHGPINKAIIGYWPGIEDLSYRYNPQDAVALLESHGWTDSNGNGIRDKDGVELEYNLLTATTPQRRLLGATVVQQQLAKIGVKVNLETLEFGTAFSKAKSGDFDMVMFGNTWWLGSDFLRYTNYSTQPTNFGRLQDPLLDHYLEVACNSPSPEEAQWAMNKAQEVITDAAAFVPLINEVQMLGAKNDVGGIDDLLTHPWWPSLMRALVLYKK